MILVIIWDGLRPDMISAERTPFLQRMAEHGVFCRASHAAFPTATRINAASLASGCYPGRHGIVDNELYVPAMDAAKPISCADWRALQRMADLEGERLVSVPTLGEILREHGRRMVSGGSGSPGTTYLTNPTVTGPVVNWAVAWPASLEGEIVARYGGMLGEESTSTERGRLVLRVLCEKLIPEHHPDVVALWLTEPDHTQHYHGLASPEALAMLRQLDEELQGLVATLEHAARPTGLTCLLASDHGFETVMGGINPDRELAEAGLKSAPESHEIVRTSNSLYLNGAVRARLGDVVRFLAGRPWVGAVFVRDDLIAQCPGAMPQSAVFGAHPRSAEIMFSYRWTANPNAQGVPGTVITPSSLAATHGSSGPLAVNNTLVAWGAGIKEGIVSDVPCGIVDVTPTVLQLLGITPPAALQGRVLREILRDGPEPAALNVRQESRTADYATPTGPRRQVARYSVLQEHRYLDWVSLDEP